MNNIRLTSLFIVGMMCIAGLIAVASSDNGSDAAVTAGSAYAPLTSVDLTLDSFAFSDTQHYYVKEGSPIRIAGDCIEEPECAVSVHVTGVTDGFGLTFSDGKEDPAFSGNLGAVSGTVSSWGRFEVSLYGYADNASGIVTGSFKLYFIVVGDVEQGETISMPTGCDVDEGWICESASFKFSSDGGKTVKEYGYLPGVDTDVSSDMLTMSVSFSTSAPLGTYIIAADCIFEEDASETTGIDYVVNLVAPAPTTFTHTVKYVSNGGTGSMSDTVVTDEVDGGTSVTLAANSFVRSGYHFVGWKVGSTVYQPGEKVPVGADASVTATAQWEANSLTIKTIPVQYAVAGKNVSFTVSVISEPSGASVTYSKSSVSSGLNVTVSGSTVTCSASSPGTYTFVLTASANGFQSDSRTVTVTIVPVLAFANTPAIGVIGN